MILALCAVAFACWLLWHWRAVRDVALITFGVVAWFAPVWALPLALWWAGL